SDSLPTVAPNFFFLDIQPQEVATLEQLVKAQSPDGKLALVPMLRGRVAEQNGEDTRQLTIPAEGGLVQRGDRGTTYSATIPENSRLVEGTWWEPDHQGDALVSFSAREAKQLGLKIGDTITVNVLGRLMTARIANLREVEWETLAMNFVMVFSPNVFAGAPHAWLGTLTDPGASAAQDTQLLNAISKALPTVTAIGVKDALQVAGDLMDQLTTGARMASSITIIASALVFAGALAASTASRIRD